MPTLFFKEESFYNCGDLICQLSSLESQQDKVTLDKHEPSGFTQIINQNLISPYIFQYIRQADWY